MTFKTLGDPHLGRQFVNNVPLHRRGERELIVKQTFIEQLDPENNKFHICMGDLFDKPVVPYDVILFAAHKYMEAAKGNPNTIFVILAGNHDLSRDLEKPSAFDVFDRIVSRVRNIVVVRDEPIVLEGMLFVPWNPVDPASEIISNVDCTEEIHTAFGHWDVDLRSDPFNLIPTKQLDEIGVRTAYTGHVHLPMQFDRDGIRCVVTGSMVPLAHGEDPDGNTYVTVSLDDVRADPAAYKNKCVRIDLKDGEIMDFQLDCLSLQVRRPEQIAEEIEVTLGDFDINKLFDQVFVSHKVPKAIQNKILETWKQTA